VEANGTGTVSLTVNGTVASGAVKTLSSGARIDSSPVAYNGLVYAGNDNGQIHAWDPATGIEPAGFPFSTRAFDGSTTRIVRARPAIRVENAVPYMYIVTGDGYLLKLNLNTVTDYVNFLPGFRAVHERWGGTRFFSIRDPDCQPVVLLDDQPIASLTDLPTPTMLGALEVYTTTAGAPASHRSACGTIIFWTKR
jgi:hypothetical protein